MEIPKGLLLEVDPEELELFLPKLRTLWLDLLKKKRRPRPSWQKKLTALWEAEAILNRQYLKEHDIQPTCRANCSACCNQPVLCRRMEVEMIIKWINRQPDNQRRQLISQIVDRVGSQTYLAERYHLVNVPGPGALEAIFNVLRGEPCAFLLQSGLCAVYPVRPIACRTARSIEKCIWDKGRRVCFGEQTDTPVDGACQIIANEIQTELTSYNTLSVLAGWLVLLAKQIKT